MTMPGFTAEGSVYKATGRYCGMNIAGLASGREGAVAALWFRPITGPIILPLQPPPQITVAYQPPPPPYGSGFPGTLTITGQYFASNVDVKLAVCNCDVDPVVIDAHTSSDRSACLAVPPYNCFTIAGGTFTATVSCYCGGGGTLLACDGPGGNAGPVAMVKAVDAVGNIAHGGTAIPC